LTGRNAANAGRITVGMLLNHTSGLYSYVTSDAGLLNGTLPNMNMPMNQFVMDLGQTPWTHSVTPQDKVLTFVNNFAPPVQIKVPVFNNISAIGNPYSTNPYFSPGAGFHYSNTNYYLLGLIVEKVTGNSVSSELQRLIINPLGLTDTYLPTTQAFQTTNFAHGYTDYFNAPYTTPLATAILRFNQGSSGWNNGDGILEDFSLIEPSFTWTTGGMVSSVKDLNKFLKYVITERVQSREEVQYWINAAPIDNATSFHYGRGLAKVANSFIGHGGQFAGYNVAAYWISGSDAYLVVMTNKYSYFESDPNNIGSIIGSMGERLYKTTLGGKVSGSDPNTAIINGILGVLASEPEFGKSLKKSTGGHLTLPDVNSITR
jgi:CubicO group peptidase (beta-lactamase class C family)